MARAPEARSEPRRALDWMFRNRETGAITVGQWPNAPLWLFLGFSGAAYLWGADGATGRALRLAAAACLAVWALDEVLRGVNPWRRLLGGTVLAGLAASFAGLV